MQVLVSASKSPSDEDDQRSTQRLQLMSYDCQ